MIRDQNVRKTAINNHEMTQSKKFEVNNKIDCARGKKFKTPDDDDDSQSGKNARDEQRQQQQQQQQLQQLRTSTPRPNFSSLACELPMKKFCNIYSKILIQLKTVKNLSENKSNETENFVDLRRQLQRADEFAIRFSRNHLYETKRILKDIKKLIVSYLMDNFTVNEGKILSKKIILAYQGASQSLQVYINYIKNPANMEVPDKISELILLIGELFLCCEHLSLPPDEVYVQNDAVKICNELMSILKSKPPIGEFLGIKHEILSKKKCKKVSCGDAAEMKNLSMYRAKAGCGKGKTEFVPKKKFGISCLLGSKARKMKKQEEEKARITHEIYTQKMNPGQGKALGSKLAKFESAAAAAAAAAAAVRDNGEHGAENGVAEKKPQKKFKYFTPREVRSQDDDVETMVQTIDDDEPPMLRIGRSPRETDDESNDNNFNKSTFQELLLDAIQDLQNLDKKEQKTTLKKLLNSIQNCSQNQKCYPRPPAVKVFHLKHRDLEEKETKEEEEEEKDGDEKGIEKEETMDGPNELVHREEEGRLEPTDSQLSAIFEEVKAKERIRSGRRRLNLIFKAINPRKRRDETKPEIVSNGKIQLKLTEETMDNLKRYKKSFLDYARNNIMYRKKQTTRPWELVDKVSDRIILDLIKEIAVEFENDDILKSLYFNELLEVV